VAITNLEILTRTDPFEILAPEVLDKVAAGLERHAYADGETIFRQGEASQDRLFIVADGLVELLVAAEDQPQTVVGVRRRYDFFGETVVLSQAFYPGTARARGDTVCLSLDRLALEDLIYRFPEFSGFFNTLLAERMRLLYEGLVADRPRTPVTPSGALLFRRQVSEIMSSPIASCGRQDSLAHAARLLAESSFGSLVVLEPDGRAAGILSARDVLHCHFIRKGASVRKETAADAMDCRVITIAPASSAARALSCMTRRGVRRLVVVERGVPIGVVSRTDLVKLYSAGALMLAEKIDAQASLASLAAVSREADEMLPALLAENAGVPEMLGIMSNLYERVNRRVLQLSEEQLRQEGRGGPPVDYCWINMGSAARREQVIRTDQDNALIYDTPPPDAAGGAARYFERLAAVAVEAMEACGFARCPGGVMASNPQWRRSLEDWNRAVAHWVASPDPEDTRQLTILLDFRTVWGRRALGHRVRDQIFAAFEASGSASHLLVRDGQQSAPPVSFLGTISTEKRGPHKNRLNLKTAGLVHIVNGLRVLAVNNRVTAASSLERLATLAERGVLDPEDADFFRTCFETLVLLSTRTNLAKVRQGQRPDHYIDPATLSRAERNLLKDALHGVSRMQKLVAKRYGLFWMNFFS